MCVCVTCQWFSVCTCHSQGCCVCGCMCVTCGVVCMCVSLRGALCVALGGAVCASGAVCVTWRCWVCHTVLCVHITLRGAVCVCVSRLSPAGAACATSLRPGCAPAPPSPERVPLAWTSPALLTIIGRDKQRERLHEGLPTLSTDRGTRQAKWPHSPRCHHVLLPGKALSVAWDRVTVVQQAETWMWPRGAAQGPRLPLLPCPHNLHEGHVSAATMGPGSAGGCPDV